MNLSASSLTTTIAYELARDVVGPIASYAVAIATGIITILILIFGEITPKSIAKESPEKFAMFAAPFLRGLMVVLRPFNFLFAQWKKLLSLIFKSEEDAGITEEELLTIVEEAEQEGGLNEEEGSLIRNAIEFSEVEAGDSYNDEGAVRVITDAATVYMPMRELVDFTAELARLNKDLKKAEEDKIFFEKKLNNPGFMAKAPADLVAKQKDGLQKALDKIALILESIKDLENM